jgi:hypothetical protein
MDIYMVSHWILLNQTKDNTWFDLIFTNKLKILKAIIRSYLKGLKIFTCIKTWSKIIINKSV